jgi:hypothetical protein
MVDFIMICMLRSRRYLVPPYCEEWPDDLGQELLLQCRSNVNKLMIISKHIRRHHINKQRHWSQNLYFLLLFLLGASLFASLLAPLLASTLFLAALFRFCLGL